MKKLATTHPKGVTPKTFSELYPRLYHMAHEHAWEQIRRHGLLSTSSLLNLWEVKGKQRSAIEREVRKNEVELRHPRRGKVVIRDQKPLYERNLRKALIDCTVQEWCQLLNRRVFFWPTVKRLVRHISARGNRGKQHLVLTVDSYRLTAAYENAITLCPLNSGNAIPFAQERGKNSLMRMSEYPFLERLARGPYYTVVELAVETGVPDIIDFVISADHMTSSATASSKFHESLSEKPAESSDPCRQISTCFARAKRISASVEFREYGDGKEAAMKALKNIRHYLMACSLVMILQPFQGLADSNTDAYRANLQQSIERTNGQRDGQHDFDFEIGTWKTHLSRRVHPLTGSTTWFEYEGTSVVRKIWDGRANLVELDVIGPTGHIEALSLRLYDPRAHQWSLNSANVKGGTLSVPTIGEFKNGRGEFYDQEPFNGRTILVRNLWSDITADSCRFEQAFSDDGGKTWEVNWIAVDTRAKDVSDGGGGPAGAEQSASPARSSRQLLEDAWWTGPMLANSAATLPHGHFLVEPYLYDVIGTHSNGFGSLTYMLYGLVDRFTVGLIPTAGFNRMNDALSSSGVGLGDLTVLGQYRLTQFHEGGWIPTTSLEVEEAFPTGKYDRLGDRPSNGFGGGAYTTTLALNSQTYFWLPNGRILRMRFNLSQALSGYANVEGVSVYDTTARFHGHAKPGGSFFVDAAWEYSLTRNWVLALDATFRHTGHTRVTGYDMGENPPNVVKNIGSSDAVGFAPAIEYNWRPNLGVLLGPRIIAIGHNTATTITPAIAINIVH